MNVEPPHPAKPLSASWGGAMWLCGSRYYPRSRAGLPTMEYTSHGLSGRSFCDYMLVLRVLVILPSRGSLAPQPPFQQRCARSGHKSSPPTPDIPFGQASPPFPTPPHILARLDRPRVSPRRRTADGRSARGFAGRTYPGWRTGSRHHLMARNFDDKA